MTQTHDGNYKLFNYFKYLVGLLFVVKCLHHVVLKSFLGKILGGSGEMKQVIRMPCLNTDLLLISILFIYNYSNLN